MKKIIITCLLILLSQPVFALDPPHNEDSGINCSECHSDILFMTDPNDMTETELDDAYNNMCLRCHLDTSGVYNGINGPMIKNHSSEIIGGNHVFTTTCIDCHHPHYQTPQTWPGRKYYPAEYQLATGMGTIIEVHSGPETVISYNSLNLKSGWTIDKLENKTSEGRGALFLPNKNSPYNSRIIKSIIGDENSGTITVKGEVTAIGTNGFTIAYGQLIKNIVPYETSNNEEIYFFDDQGNFSFTNSDTIYNGICETCHTQTRHFRNDGSAPNQIHTEDQNGTPAKVGAGVDCIICHRHENGFGVNKPSHVGNPGSDWVMVFEEGEHDSAAEGDSMVYVACNQCHNTHLSDAHDYQCMLCHESPADTIIGIWNGGCQQGGCHITIHDDASESHQSVSGQCGKCHDVHGDWWPTADKCKNCHAVYNPTDTTPPVTTSNAQASYIGGAHIKYSVTDSGKVTVAQTYSRLDGGEVFMGSEFTTTTPGSHTLEFWSVDQANNIESPPNTVVFEIIADTTPPVTTSNALSSYYQKAIINLNATDNSSIGVKTTYYIVDGGVTNTGTYIAIYPPDGETNHTVQFWSTDWSGNVEDINEVTFTIKKGIGTFSMWGGGTSCANDIGADAYWYIKNSNYNGTIIAQGTDGCNVSFLIGPQAYYIMIEWWNGDFWDEYIYPGQGVTGVYYLTTPNEIIVLD